MKIHPQTIYSDGKAEFVVLPIKEYNILIKVFENLQDIQEVRAHLDSQSETFPMEMVIALSEKENPIKVYREERGVSQSE